MKKLTAFFSILMVGAIVCLFQYGNVEIGSNLTPLKMEEEPPQGIMKSLTWLHEMRANQVTGEVRLKDMLQARQQANTMKLAKDICEGEEVTRLEWEELGPLNVGGRTRTLLVDKDDPTKLYSGGVAGGIWTSNDWGANWEQYQGNGDLPSLAVTQMVQDADGTIYVGTGEWFPNMGISGNFFGGGVPGAGIYRSTDGGNNFEPIDATNPGMLASNPSGSDWAFVNGMVVDPTQVGVVYAATNRGLWQTDDGGDTWFRPSGLESNTGVCWDVDAAIDGTIFAYLGGNLYRTNADGHFENITTSSGLPFTGDRKKLAMSPTDANYGYLVVINNGCLDLVYQTTNGGDTWNEIGAGGSGFLNPCAEFCQCWYDLAIDVDPTNPERIFLGGVTLYSWSSDDGWVPIDNLASTPGNLYYIHADKHEIVFDDNSPGVVYIVGDGGIFRSENATQLYPTFTDLNKKYNVTQFYSVAAGWDGEVMGGTQDNGTPYIAYNFQSIGSSLRVFGGDGGYTDISDFNPNGLFAETQNGNIRRSSNQGDSFGSFFDTNADEDQDGVINGGSPFITSFFLWENTKEYYDTIYNAMDTVKQRAMFFTGGNNGQLWMTRNPTSFSSIPAWQKLGGGSDNFTGGNAALSDLKVSNDGKTAFAVSRGGSILRITNLDKANPTVARISSSLFSGRYVTGIAFNPYFPLELYVVAGNYANDFHVFKSDNAMLTNPNNVTFNEIQGNLPLMPVYDISFDAFNFSHQLVIGTELGIWTYNGFTNCWTEQNDGIGRVPVFRVRHEDMRAKDCSVLYIGTHGRGLFRATNLTFPFCDTELVFDVGTGVETVEQATNTLAIFPNPMTDRATIAYELASTTEVVVSVHDIQGKLLKQFKEGNKTAGKHSFTLQKDGWSAGNYLVSLRTPMETITKQLVVVE